ncbi:MAG TPA: hypothetical protein PKE03_04475 [Bacteroidales bacterium]|nr:hypothetical protein [Bacteroidales bacterium]
MHRLINRLIFFVIATLIINNSAQAQSRGLFPETPEFNRKWVLGGDFGMGFSSTGSSILIAPQLGYKINPDWEAGFRFTYNYRSYRWQDLRIRTHDKALGAYTNYEFWRGLFAHAETEWLQYTPVYITGSPIWLEKGDVRIFNSIFVGGGYRQYYSTSGYAYLLLLYNLSDSFDSPYSNPIIRAGVAFGLGKPSHQAGNKSTKR